MTLLFQRTLEEVKPAWLADADALIPDSTELPQDALDFAGSLSLTAGDAFASISQAQRKVDLERRAIIGAAGERLLFERLTSHWPGRTSHVSLEDDGLGFDIVLALGPDEYHLEVKTTTRRGRLVVYLSRNEHEVSLVDPDWRLVVVGLGEDEGLAVVATVRYDLVGLLAPQDQGSANRWENVRLELIPGDLEPGLPFLQHHLAFSDSLLAGSPWEVGRSFTWLPSGAGVSRP